MTTQRAQRRSGTVDCTQTHELPWVYIIQDQRLPVCLLQTELCRPWDRDVLFPLRPRWRFPVRSGRGPRDFRRPQQWQQPPGGRTASHSLKAKVWKGGQGSEEGPDCVGNIEGKRINWRIWHVSKTSVTFLFREAKGSKHNGALRDHFLAHFPFSDL